MSMKPEVKSIFTAHQGIVNHPERDPCSTPSCSPLQHPATAAAGRPRSLSDIQAGAEVLSQAERQTAFLRALRAQDICDKTAIHDSLATPTDAKYSPNITSNFRRPLRSSPQSVNPPPLTLKSAPNASKRLRSGDSVVTKGSSGSEPLRKRPKLRPRHSIDPENYPTGIARVFNQPQSPLFFSHSARQRPNFPSSFSSQEAADMLNKARDDVSGTVTLKLARGSVSQTSPRSISTPGSWASVERNSMPRTPSTRGAKSGWQVLGSIGIIELLEQDERPTFILDVANTTNFNPGGPLQIVFANAALRAYDSILEMVTGRTELESPGVAVTSDFPEFKSWALSFVRDSESLDVCLPSFLYGGIHWSCSTLRKRLRLISGTPTTTAVGSSAGALSNSPVASERARGATSLDSIISSPPILESTEPVDYFGDATLRLPSTTPGDYPTTTYKSLPKQAMLASETDRVADSIARSRLPENSFDWTRLPNSIALPRHIQFARSIDWAATPLGPIESWSYDLRAMCNLIMGSPNPAAMYWGEEYVAIYNEAYILLAGQKHPTLMGQSYKDAWKEIWNEVEEVFTNARQSGQATMKDDDQLFVKRNGFLEESYFSWSIVPLIGEDGTIKGLYNPAFEKTRRKIAERRMLTLREIGEKTAAAKDVKAFWGQVIKGLAYNEYDVPFALLYSVNDVDPDSDMSSIHSGSLAQAPQCVLEGTLGVPAGHRSTASPLDLKTSDDGFAPYLRESMKTDGPVLLTVEDGSLPAILVDGLENRGFGDPCRSVVVFPCHPTTGESILGFLVMGINPRRPYDDDYSLFIQLTSRQLATSMASVVLFEEEIKRGQIAAKLAALDRQELSKQLDLRTQEAVESETKFTRMAEFAPVGMFIADSKGDVNFANDAFWELSRHPRSEFSAKTWIESIRDEDKEQVRILWQMLITEKKAINHEFRFKTFWSDRNGNRSDTWVLMSAYPEKYPNGDLKSVFGSITNISQQKWAEDLKKRRMEEAIEMKRQQENFIDITSHEMRNPLSAILQCADEISTTLGEFRNQDESSRTIARLHDILESSVDAAQTIALCAQHQKRIVDDILTLSKLDSALLLVTPVDVQPVAVVQRALKMFEGELETNDIGIEFRIEQNYLDLSVDWVKLDPSRLLQVLINLTTNAIKFTHTQTKRTIIVSIGASTERPGSGGETAVSYFPTRKLRDVTDDELEWGSGENIYLTFAVQDTGRGLDDDEKKLLFMRFSQASPRTHVQYGGSGLGLFISRELTELQGGEIGVASERGVGSTFAFFVKARKVDSGTQADNSITNSLMNLRKNPSNNSMTIESRKTSGGKGASGSGAMAHSSQGSSLPAVGRRPSVESSMFKILIVEDNLVNQRVLQKQLVNSGMKVHVANHGVEALDLLKTSRFWKGKEKDGIELSVILMDLEMPIMDGLTCARKIRELEAEGTLVSHVPIVAVTANARLEQIESAKVAGMDDVVSKPFRIPDLIPKIEELVEKSKQQLKEKSVQ
ncbi:hypothetical protein BP5796_03323 [Coleophoma crateriformis]|uniref:Sensory transduction histidine kinase n=1 Tax=Coleophoma crateriformis TaxID=565419 RepID=A0A3D8SMQ5_9HELO|nr:hypothetical protein BP5796_03323 [Coleophoma crateriformis]